MDKKPAKAMKRYISAVKRRLNLPKDLTDSAVDELVRELGCGLDAGLSEQEVIQKHGTPAEAAGAIHEKMRPFVYRKSPWRFVFAALAVYSGLELAGCLAARLVAKAAGSISFPANASSTLGIIGGADGPTAIFVTMPAAPVLQIIRMLLLLAAGIFGFIRLSRCKQK